MSPLCLLCAIVIQGGNLLANPEFGRNLTGWEPLWTRDPSVGTAKLIEGHDGHAAIQVKHSGKQDWSFAQSQEVPVHAGQILRLSGWLKAEQSEGAELSVVTRTAQADVLDWSYGAVKTSGSHDWKRFARRLVVPAKCATVQFRLIGYGTGTVSLSEPEMVLAGEKGPSTLRPIRLSNPKMSLTMSGDGALVLTDKRSSRTWRTREFDPDLMIDGQSTVDSLHAGANLRDLTQDRMFALKVSLDPVEAVATLALSGDLPMSGNLRLPAPIETAAGQWLIVPMNEGILYPVDDATVDPVTLVTYSGHGICMPWFGVVDSKSGAGAMTTFATPDDADIAIDRHNGLLDVQPQWEPSRGDLRYERKVSIRLIDKGGYVAMAKAYRQTAKEQGLFKTLAEKRKNVPAVDRLVGAVNVWNWDMDKVAFCRELKSMGFDHVLWSGSGTADEIGAINGLGFLSSRYDIYQDVWDPKTKLSWMPSDGWPEDLVLLPNGDWMKGWAHPDKQPDGSVKWIQGGVICSERGLERAKKFIPEELKRIPFECRFIDTTTASPFRECYNPAHPLTRSDDKKYKMDLLDFCSKQGLVVGSETGIDPSVPSTSYYEGMMSLGPYRLPDAGTDMIAYRKPTPEFLKYQVGSFYRIPLWELVYHDCTVAQWYWGDASNKTPEVWDRRDLLNILYGTAPLLMFDKDRWAKEKQRALKTYNEVCKWDRRIGYDEMLSHEFLTPDHTIQRTTWSSGKAMTVNFGEKPWQGIGAMSFREQ